MQNQYKKFFFTWSISIIISLLIQFVPVPSQAQTVNPVYDFTCPLSTNSNNDPNSAIPDKWKTKFPFDLVYPISDLHTDIATKCPTITLFGTARQLCSVSMIAAIAKNIFLLKIAIQSLLQL